jgi:hypothetical protein
MRIEEIDAQGFAPQIVPGSAFIQRLNAGCPPVEVNPTNLACISG